MPDHPYPGFFMGVAEDVFALPSQLVGEGQHFVLTMTDDSMIHAGIETGDWAVIRQQPRADNGQLVAAKVEDKMTIRMLARCEGQDWLLASNASYQPRPVFQATILGRLVGLVRKV